MWHSLSLSGRVPLMRSQYLLIWWAGTYDIRTTTSNNLHLVRDWSGLDSWSSSSKGVKSKLEARVSVVPDHDTWRVPYLARLLEQRGELHHEMLDTSVLTELIDSICVNWCPFSDLFPSSSVGPAPTHYGWIDDEEEMENWIFFVHNSIYTYFC